MKRTPLVLITALVLLVPAATALAASLPKPPDSTVVVPTSIAGVKLGMSEAKARIAWGGAGRGTCVSSETSGRTRCEYGSEHGGGGHAYFEVDNGKVEVVVVYGGVSSAGKYLPSAAGALMKMKTDAGIGIGSKYSKVKSAFPEGEPNGAVNNTSFNYAIRTKGGDSFSFGLVGAAHKVYAIGMNTG